MRVRQIAITRVFAAMAILSLSALSCNLLLDPVVKNFPSDLWENRPDGISCFPTASSSTLNNNKLTFRHDHMLCIDIQMDSAEFEIMRYESRFGPDIRHDGGKTIIKIVIDYLWNCDVPFPSEFNWYQANVTIDGLEAKGSGIRKKGFLGSIFSVAPGLIVETGYYQAGGSFGETTRLTLNNNAEDASRIIQCVNYHVFEMADYPAPRCNIANVSINGEALGVYTHLETIDESFLLREFGNINGHLYEGQLADFVEAWRFRWDAKGPASDPSATPLLAVSRILEEVPDTDLEAELEKHLNMDRFITFWALEALLAHWDGYTGNRNNFFIYLDPADNGRITFIPWGMNYFFGEFQSTSLRRHVTSEIPRRLSRIPEFATRFETELKRLSNDVWDETELENLVDSLAAMVPFAQDDENYDEQVESVKLWIADRTDIIDSLLVKGLPKGDSTGGKCLFNNNEDLANGD